MKITDFFNNEYIDQASYDNLRKISSLVDGQKNSSRKILFTVLEKNIKDEIKVSQLNSKVAEYSEYLHGDLSSVIVNMAQNFTGTNNINLLHPEGSFGNRFSQVASAPRYIYTHKSKYFDNLFNKDDNNILIQQTFEGNRIEPLFYVPTLPILLLNGSEGVSSGYAQKILNRNPKKIIQYIKDYLNGKLKPNKNNSLEPYFEGFKGTVEQGDNHKQFLIKGTIERISSSKIRITEIPFYYELKEYCTVLDDLEDKGLITSYKDKSENNEFKFEVTINSKILIDLSDDEVLDRLKLIKKVTENYTCMDESNKIIVLENVKEILDHYIKIKLEYIKKRKDYQLESIQEKIQVQTSRFIFIKNIVDEILIINKRSKAEVEKDLEKIDKIIKVQDSFDYLLNMSLISLTKERMEKLKEEIITLKEELTQIENTSIEQMWLYDLSSF